MTEQVIGKLRIKNFLSLEIMLEMGDTEWPRLQTFVIDGPNHFQVSGHGCDGASSEAVALSGAKVSASSAANRAWLNFKDAIERGRFRDVLVVERVSTNWICRKRETGKIVKGPEPKFASIPRQKDRGSLEAESAAQDRLERDAWLAETSARERAAHEKQAQQRRARLLEVKLYNGDLYEVQLRFFSQHRLVSWPNGRDQVWLPNPHVPQTYRLSCNPGEKICLGASRRGGDYNWGVGVNGQLGCKNCCVTCGEIHELSLKAGPHPTLSSQPSVSVQESNSSALGDILDLGLGILGGVSGNVGGGGVGGGYRRAPPPKIAPRTRPSDISR